MPNSWKLTQALQEEISTQIVEKGPEGIGTRFYPSILWSLGGERKNYFGDIEKILPGYTLGWVKAEDLSRFIAIESKEFKYIAFQPSRDHISLDLKVLDIVNGDIIIVGL